MPYRILAVTEGEVEHIDYTVVSVGVMTLGLLLFVEVIRHGLDHKAVGRPFFKTVLEGVYSELATLGIVELMIYLLHKYYKNLNVARELIFADVHFTLFYTAIFNAFQSVMLAMFATRVSHKLWVRTEYLELDHYVEIREEFDIVSALLYQRDEMTTSRPWWYEVMTAIGKPRLRARYLELLVQIRFHQLRIHFLEGNQLPLNLKVSEYLKRAEQSVLIKLVHVSTFAWLFLTGGLNLIYFVMGMVAYATEDPVAVGKTMAYFYFGSMIIFILFSLGVYYKMKVIFRIIINMKRTDSKDTEAHKKGVKDQLNLFWGGDPQLVIAVVQFMQFGYALALAIILVFWEDLDGTIPRIWYLVAVLGCYSIFIYVMAQVIPQYTLCTSLGYLVNQKHLQESLALYRLTDAQRKQKRQLACMAYENDSVIILEDETSLADTTSISDIGSVGVRSKASMRHARSFSMQEEEKNVKLAELVKMDTSSLRTYLPQESRDTLMSREQRIKARVNRRKSVSDGVAMMRALHVPPMLAPIKFKSLPVPEPARAKDDADVLKESRAERIERRTHARKKSVSASAVIQSWQDFPLITESHSTEGSGEAPDTIMPKRRGRGSRSRSITPPLSWLHPLHEHPTSPSEASAHSQGKSQVDDFFGAPPAASTHSRPKSQMNGFFGAPSDATAHSQPEEQMHDFFGAPVVGAPIVDFVPPDRPDDDRNDPPEDEADHQSVDTAKSIGGLSDVAEVLDAEKLAPTKSLYTDKSFRQSFMNLVGSKSIFDHMRSYYLSKRYITISHVFGTLVCFFLIGNRVESMLASTLVVEESSNTWALALYHSFWWELTWYCIFLYNAVVILVLFPKPLQTSAKERSRFFAAAVDILISGASLIFLVVAESQRCCGKEEQDELLLTKDDDYHRFLAGATEVAATDATYNSSGYDYGKDSSHHEVDDCCPKWGRRTYGGLGNIEPFTGLIALRVSRFVVAGAIVRYLEARKNGKNGNSSTDDEKSEPALLQNHLFGQIHKGSMQNEEGTALELWERAIAKYPDIVAQYGEFSGELFQAMLGLQIMIQKQPTSELPATVVTPGVAVSGADATPAIHRRTALAIGGPSQRMKLSSAQYADLPPEAQGIILAGKVGKPVKSILTPLRRTGSEDSNFDNLPTLEEEDHDLQVPIPRSGPVEFEIDNDQLALEAKESDYNPHGLVDPTARLIRAMRRCDRRLLPLLSNWVTVDVVITQFEIVYFEAIDLLDNPSDTPEARRVKESTRLALNATKGGNGLRLCDVAVGRKVAGHLDLSEITELHIERSMPVENVTSDASAEHAGQKEPETEYWSDGSPPKEAEPVISKVSRNLRWAKIKEDRLKLISVHGTLYLRFYSDLEDTEGHLERSTAENELSGPLSKNIAFQWAQTVGRLCGREQLKQNLPHFCDDSPEELRDYLEVVHFHEKESDRGHHRRRSSMLPLDLNMVHGSDLPKPALKKSSSSGDAPITPSPVNPVNRKRFQPSISFGEGLSSASSRGSFMRRASSTSDFFKRKPFSKAAMANEVFGIAEVSERESEAGIGDVSERESGAVSERESGAGIAEVSERESEASEKDEDGAIMFA